MSLDEYVEESKCNACVHACKDASEMNDIKDVINACPMSSRQREAARTRRQKPGPRGVFLHVKVRGVAVGCGQI